MSEMAADRVEAYLASVLLPSEVASGKNFDVGADEETPLWSDDLRHLLAAAEQRVAAAWDEGAGAALRTPPHLGYTLQNPYRIARTAADTEQAGR